MDWLEICVTVDEDLSEAAAEVLQLFAIGDEGVAIEQLGDESDVAPMAMLPESRVKLFVDLGRDSAELRQSITDSLNKSALPSPFFSVIREQDWANAWREHYHTLRIGKRFVIRPTWESAENNDVHDLVISLDPGMAFGTGTHETTQLCLELLETVVETGNSVYDLGTGSGILAIGAKLLGASNVLAADNDPIAVNSTIENVKLNQLEGQIVIQEGSLGVENGKRFDVVVANILAPILIKLLQVGLLDTIYLDGTLILSGILASQVDDVDGAVASAGGRVRRVSQLNDWVAMVVGFDSAD